MRSGLWVIILVLIVMQHTALSEERPVTADEDREMIEMLDMLENYDTLSSDMVYEFLNDSEESESNGTGLTDNGDGGVR